ICCCWPESRRLGDQFVLKLSLAFALALGLCSCSFFLKLVLFPRAEWGYVLAENALYLILLIVLALAFRKTRPPPEPMVPGSADVAVWWRRRLGTSLLVAVVASLSGALLWQALRPHGDWDAWALWNMYARFLYRGGEHWSDYIRRLEWNLHSDYPLLV